MSNLSKRLAAVTEARYPTKTVYIISYSGNLTDTEQARLDETIRTNSKIHRYDIIGGLPNGEPLPAWKR